jgi:thymidylate kinase/thymidylate synthase ThyX
MEDTAQEQVNGREKKARVDEQQQGIFIAIEGTDGSGKGTQFKLLAERLQNDGYDVATFDFPRYDQPSSYFVKKYLNGDYGSGNHVSPYTGSLFYALDRYDASQQIREALAEGKIVLANRYAGSNMAHQGTKFRSAEQRRGYFIWLDNLEFEMLGIPRPTLNLVLRVPAEIAQSLVDQKDKRDYTDQPRDLHEADLSHLQKSVEVYDDLCQLFPKDFARLDAVRGGELLPIATIQQLIYEKLTPLLPPPAAQAKTSKNNPAPSAKSDNPYVHKLANGAYEITEAGRKWLEDAVSNIDSNVYATGYKLESLTAAAAMARLSRRGDDMRVTILDEFAENVGKDDGLIHRVITAYGDDSVQQLVGQHIVVENASNLLTKKLEWGRLAAYLEQSTRYIYFDQKDAEGKYKYFVPDHFDLATKKVYIQHMDKIFDKYSQLVHDLTDYIRANDTTPEAERDGAWKAATKAQACDAARPVLPVATRATVGIFASGQALESLIMHLLADELPESKKVGQQILAEARKVIPTFLERADKPERGGAMVAYRANTQKAVHNLAEQYLPENYPDASQKSLELTDIWPRNELDLVPDMLYARSSLPLTQLRQEASQWPYDKKLDIFNTYIGERLNRRHRPGRALEKAHYSWDILCDYGIFRDLQRHRMVDDLEWQQLTPRYGFDTPNVIEEANLTDIYEKCYDLSLKLHGLLQQNGYPDAAQYATLLGHKMRWKVTMNAREMMHFVELRTSPQGHPGYRRLALAMHEILAEHHPLIASAIKFVNQDEDPKLTRLAAERATQFKLQQQEAKQPSNPQNQAQLKPKSALDRNKLTP